MVITQWDAAHPAPGQLQMEVEVVGLSIHTQQQQLNHSKVLQGGLFCFRDGKWASLCLDQHPSLGLMSCSWAGILLPMEHPYLRLVSCSQINILISDCCPNSKINILLSDYHPAIGLASQIQISMQLSDQHPTLRAASYSWITIPVCRPDSSFF